MMLKNKKNCCCLLAKNSNYSLPTWFPDLLFIASICYFLPLLSILSSQCYSLIFTLLGRIIPEGPRKACELVFSDILVDLWYWWVVVVMSGRPNRKKTFLSFFQIFHQRDTRTRWENLERRPNELMFCVRNLEKEVCTVIWEQKSKVAFSNRDYIVK